MHTSNELIEDREIDQVDADHFGHESLVEQLFDVAMTVSTPSNVALYGAWGSGKSGIGKLLEQRLSPIRGIKFARFDAFKYAQNPLRRNFISVVANELNCKNDKFHKNLYSDKVETDFTVPGRKVLGLLRIFALIALVAVLVVSGCVALFALIQGEDPFKAMISLMGVAVPSSLVPAALLTALVALVGRTFVQEKRVEKAQSDEEFELLFAGLITASRADRVVIFVDELDRCSPDDVVETLDTLRTFFGVEGCVFIVAADPQVLEHAISEGSKQANPTDPTNPYYSTGSEYLDKVFQYQISVPPLMPQSVTRFAVGLVEARSGVWQNIDIPVVVSVLIPTHVRSPRRVKNLLNSFALAYRLASSRQKMGILDVEMPKIAEELARIVCIKAEFPLFARDLQADPELSSYVLELSESNDEKAVWKKYPSVLEPMRVAAQEYAKGFRPVDRLLIDGGGIAAPSEDAKIVKAHGQQLLDYLSRTRFVTGPTKALIHLQDSGPLFGLPSAIASEIEREALNGNISGLLELHESLSGELQLPALQMLAQLARSAVGHEAPNVSRSIFALLRDGVPSSMADPLAVALLPLAEQFETVIDASTAVGVWNLVVATDRAEAHKLGSHVLTLQAARDDQQLQAAILAHSATALRVGDSLFVDLLIDSLLGDSAETLIASLVNSSPENRVIALNAVGPSLSTVLSEKDSARKEWESEESDQSDPDESAEEPQDVSSVIKMLSELLVQVSETDPDSAEKLLVSLLASKRTATMVAVRDSIKSLPPIARSQQSVALIMASANRTHYSWWAHWFAVIDPEAILSPDSFRAELESFITRMTRVTAAGDEPYSKPAVTNFADSVLRLTDSSTDTNQEAFSQAALKDLTVVTEPDEIAKLHHQLEIANLLAAAGLFGDQEIWLAEAASLVSTFEIDGFEDPDAVPAEMLAFLTEALERLARAASRLGEHHVEAQNALVSSIGKCEWLSGLSDVSARSLCYRFIPERSRDAGLPVPSSAEVLALKEQTKSYDYEKLVVHWLHGTDAELQEMLDVTHQFLERQQLSLEMQSAISAWRVQSGSDEQRELVRQFVEIRRPNSRPEEVAKIVGMQQQPEAVVAEMLINRLKAATTNPHRLEVLPLWDAMGFKNEAVRVRLVREVLIPIFNSGITAAEPALTYLPKLAKPIPRGTKSLLGDAVVKSTKGRDAESKAERYLEALGFKFRVEGLIRRRRSIDTSD